MKRRQAKKNAKKLFGGRTDLRVTYRRCAAGSLRGMTELAGIIDVSWHIPGDVMETIRAAEDARVLGILDNITNVKRVEFPGPYDGPLYNPPIEEMPVPGKHYDDAMALDKKLHPEVLATIELPPGNGYLGTTVWEPEALQNMDVKCLRAMAKAKGIKGSVSTMKKQDLIDAILANQGETK